MVLRSNRTITIPKHIVFQAGGVVFLFATAALALHSTFAPETVATCEERYNRGVQFALAGKSGEPLTTDLLQARLGGRDWGLTANTSIVAVKNAPAAHALEVSLKRATGSDEATNGKSGVGFTWQPRALDTAKAACLGYSVWVPTDFQAGTGGILPGIYGDKVDETAGENAKASLPFSTRIRWRSDSTLDLVMATQEAERVGSVKLESSVARLTPEKWVHIEQEVILNKPGANDGVVRIWVDGVLVLNRNNMTFRADPTQRFNGIVSDIHNTRQGIAPVVPSRETKLRISPFELRVR